ncbi:hypothetical protein B0T22DRAFT_437908 [Podospora appendiculata]|uniref:Uncharacterized protein n=1 Tax=Podospora appendiculata TaxID=314037 RepID=A0AAE1CHM5_9PEZI|nr:hypothetical protein B0T22DRAFT_437908 [Podospora appendiculata]
MPFPPSDEELLAGFTDQEKEFFAWYHDSIIERGRAGFFGFPLLVRARFPDPELQEQYHAWSDKWFGRHAARQAYRISPTEFFRKIASTTFTNTKSRNSWHWMMKTCNTPFCFLGQSDFGGVLMSYGLQPSSDYLHPNLEAAETKSLVHYSILSVSASNDVDLRPTTRHSDKNMPAQPSPGEDSIFSGGSASSVDSSRCGSWDSWRWDMVDAPFPESAEGCGIGNDNGFLVAQLGRLHVSAGKSGGVSEGPWVPANYGVVVEIGKQGQPGAVYVLFNFHDGRPCIPLVDGQGWPKTFTLAKIANSPQELAEASVDFETKGTVKHFNFEVISDNECHIAHPTVEQIQKERMIELDPDTIGMGNGPGLVTSFDRHKGD